MKQLVILKEEFVRNVLKVKCELQSSIVITVMTMELKTEGVTLKEVSGLVSQVG